MGVSLPGGRGKNVSVDLNLVPFVDFLSCLIAFLMMTAVLSNLHALALAPSGGDEGEPAEEAVLTVRVSADALAIGRQVLVRHPHREGAPDWSAAEAALRADLEVHPVARPALLRVDDGVAYADAAAALDLLARLDQPPPLLTGGPAAE